MLQYDDFEKIFDTIYKNFSLQNNAEITLEANPDDLNTEFFLMIKNFPINRLSVGIQSFNNKLLKVLNRRHTAEQGISAVENAKNNGFTNISIDLIYGLPKQSLNSWKKDLETAFSLDVQHISAYGLGIEKGTKLWQMRENNEIKPATDSLMLKMYEYAEDEAIKHGFEHYEISNYALRGFRSAHNSAYWTMQKYLGAGPSAHSFDGASRQWNTASIEDYINAIKNGKDYFEQEILTPSDKFNDYVMLSLRTTEGIDLEYVKQYFDSSLYSYLIKNTAKYISQKHIEINDNNLRLTRKGINISNLIISDLLVSSE